MGSDRSAKVLIWILVVAAAVWLIYDFVWILSPTFDINQHVPFLFPIVLACFASIFKFIDRYQSAESILACEKVAKQKPIKSSSIH